MLQRFVVKILHNCNICHSNLHIISHINPCFISPFLVDYPCLYWWVYVRIEFLPASFSQRPSPDPCIPVVAVQRTPALSPGTGVDCNTLSQIYPSDRENRGLWSPCQELVLLQLNLSHNPTTYKIENIRGSVIFVMNTISFLVWSGSTLHFVHSCLFHSWPLSLICC